MNQSNPNDLLDLYLDGMLTGPERAAFERSVAADPTLRAAVEAQSRIDQSLGRAFAPPAVNLGFLNQVPSSATPIEQIAQIPSTPLMRIASESTSPAPAFRR